MPLIAGGALLTLNACGSDPGSAPTGDISTTGTLTSTTSVASGVIGTTGAGTTTTGDVGSTTTAGTGTTGNHDPSTTTGITATGAGGVTTGAGGSTSSTSDSGTTTGTGGVTSGGETATSTDGATTTTGSAGTTGGECTDDSPPAPPSEIQASIDRTWEEMTGELDGLTGARSRNASVANRMNLTLDEVMAAGGTLSVCVSWGSSSDPVSPELRDAIEAALSNGVNEWFKHLTGYDCFPYATIGVAVTAWAVTNRDLLEWEDGVVPIYVGAGDNDGLPPCPEQCSSLRQGLDSTFPNCEGGYTNHYDQVLHLQHGLGNTGFGESEGQWVDLDGFVNSTGGNLYHIWLHEFGHGIGFPDYYDWDTWGNGEDPPNSVMVAGRAIVVTEWDSWMMRRVWSELKPRWDP